MKKRFLGAALAALISTSAVAQVNFTPQAGLISGYYFKQTYSAAFFGLVPAASATDLVCLSGSATKTVRLVDLKLSGTAGTLVTLPVNVLRRIALDSGGTAASTTANPANTIASRDTGQGLNTAASAVPISYTANPTINDSSPVYVDSALFTLNTTAAATNPIATDFNFAALNSGNVLPPTVRGAAQQICVNLGGVSISSGVVNGVITWTEE